MAAFKIILLLIIGAALGYFIKTSALKVLKLSLWCYAFMMLGYFMYFTSMIRSHANPGIDMNNVDNPINLVYYLGREQYGSAPLFMVLISLPNTGMMMATGWWIWSWAK
ncbi:hypothetical protein LWM68_30500 [Niabella sp. W65]|nr:hypothetical protein [Niabella sp. W65]MCH7366707.1 hypothetical protein [Niabella sp. W65]ULT42410.1 hypothetical protein KRR40_02010 [Niabella sp. I65]